MESAERQRLVLDRLREAGRVEVADLARETRCSVITIRRDLDQLARVGALRRVRGGAVSSGLRGEGLPFAMRASENAEGKGRLAAVAADLISDGEAVGLDSGTTAVAVARALFSRRVTVMPMSVQGIGVLSTSATASVVVPGGTVHPTEGSLSGPLLEAAFARTRLDTAVLSCCGAAEAAGVTAFDFADAAAKQAMMRSANRTILVAEAAKFALTAMAVVCPLTDFDVIVTEQSAPRQLLQTLEDAGAEVHLV
ncbi:DeoR/GlpR family DNA-binding transcription regulator [Nocardioides sp. BP30]|uniref:DeoR/GlpR family DNA-binding transcription regulator n=1 Tax=Nocardioides sp. BP30 TaxID=3036374 RepID=UPI0024695313|nr:DeoR/GlpR family DNA-binding transcription regulator [Nocardioides sp. BP30]WGL52460.1 DeoR/GlpR family DNA-binding transcription regulator [Nocardioides sp. BP30]